MRWLINKLKGSEKTKTWKDIEYFNPEWKDRIETMALFISPKANTIIDLGCGKMWLKNFLRPGIKYIPVDYISRADDTIVCDFNNYAFPAINADVAFVSGCLEYVEDYNWFVREIALHTNQCILSYCVMEEFPDVQFRKAKTWVNDLTENEIIDLFGKNNFLLQAKLNTKNRIFYFTKNAI